MSLLSDRTNLTSTTQFKALGRALYRQGYSGIQVSPVSKGTWTVSATAEVETGPYSSRRQSKRWTGLDSLTEVENALSEALDWVAERGLDASRR